MSCAADGGGPAAPRTRPPAADPWRLELPAGSYNVSAKFPNGEYPNRNGKQLIYPPYTECEI